MTHSVQVGDALPERVCTPDNIDLFFYNAALWNAHRIHFDLPYATEVEGYQGLVVPGPLLGDWLGQCVDEWVDGSGRLVRLEYSNRLAAYSGDTLTVGGTVSSIDAESGEASVDLYVKNEEGAVVTPGKALIRLDG
ncbi:MAG: hypothetical protein OXE40_17850 [Gammaproteobacteria bacterium]|nr:hypothetical protein [Gammaproteobacteria bacterium]